MNSVICWAASTSTGPWRNLQNGTGHCSLQYIYTRDQIHIYSNNFMKVNRWPDLPWKEKERRSNIFRRSTWSSRRYTGAPCKNEIIYSRSRFFLISASDKVHHWIIDIWSYGQDTCIFWMDVHISRKKEELRICSMLQPARVVSVKESSGSRFHLLWPYQLPPTHFCAWTV